MKPSLLRTVFVTIVAFFAISGIAWAAQLRSITSRLGGATGDYFDLNGTLLVDSIKVGSQGVGGVTYFNGSIVNSTTDSNNADNPITFGDNVRIDGEIWRGSTKGPGDNFPIKLNDDVRVFGDLTIDSGKTITVSGVSWSGAAFGPNEIADTTQRVALPLSAFYRDPNDTPTSLSGSSGDPLLLYAANQGLFARFTRTTNATTGDIGTQFIVPADYASGGKFKVLLDTSAAIVTNWDIDFEVSISQVSGTGAWDADMDDETAVDVSDSPNVPRIITLTPRDQADFSAGDTVFFRLFPANHTGAGEPDVEIYQVWFEYTASQ